MQGTNWGKPERLAGPKLDTLLSDIAARWKNEHPTMYTGHKRTNEASNVVYGTQRDKTTGQRLYTLLDEEQPKALEWKIAWHSP